MIIIHKQKMDQTIKFTIEILLIYNKLSVFILNSISSLAIYYFDYYFIEVVNYILIINLASRSNIRINRNSIRIAQNEK